MLTSEGERLGIVQRLRDSFGGHAPPSVLYESLGDFGEEKGRSKEHGVELEHAFRGRLLVKFQSWMHDCFEVGYIEEERDITSALLRYRATEAGLAALEAAEARAAAKKTKA